MQNVSRPSVHSTPSMPDLIGKNHSNGVMSILLIPPSGKATRARLRAAHAQSNPTVSLIATSHHHALSIPHAAYARASDYIPISWSFDNEGPDLGLRQSPYLFTPPDLMTITAVEETSNDLPALKLNSLQFDWAQEEGAARFRAWSRPDADEGMITAAAFAELQDRILAWSALVTAQDDMGLSEYIRDVYVNWGAKRMVWLEEELEIRQQGLEAYINAYRQKELPTQVLYTKHVEYLESSWSIEYLVDYSDVAE